MMRPKRTSSKSLLTALLAPLGMALLLSAPLPAQGATFDQTHAQFTRVLQGHVAQGLVDYAKLKKNPTELKAYLDELAGVKKADFKQWEHADQIAFLVNLYNAATLKLIIDRYPIASIKDIGWLLKGPWDQKVVRVFGKTTTLAHVEHKILRAHYTEPRIHFALVCAAMGCPVLRNEAYTGANLDAQLNEQGRQFLRDKTKNRVDIRRKTLYLSPIFKWFDDDFEETSRTVQRFVTPYFTEEDQKALKGQSFRIRYTDYDWSLNRVRKS